MNLINKISDTNNIAHDNRLTTNPFVQDGMDEIQTDSISAEDNKSWVGNQSVHIPVTRNQSWLQWLFDRLMWKIFSFLKKINITVPRKPANLQCLPGEFSNMTIIWLDSLSKGCDIWPVYLAHVQDRFSHPCMCYLISISMPSSR